MQPLMGSEVSKLHAQDLLRDASPRCRGARVPLRVSLGMHLVDTGVRLMGRRAS